MVIHIFGVLLLLGISCQAHENYEGYVVLEVVPETEQQLQDLAALAQNDQLNLILQLDFWQEPSKIGRPVHIMVPPEGVEFVENMLQQLHLDVDFHISDVSDQILSERLRLQNKASTYDMDYDDFNTFEDIMEELDELARDCPDDISCEILNIGASLEERPLRVFKMSKAGDNRKAYWLDATIHAREWIATATIMRILRTMVKGEDDVVSDYLDRFDWYFLPVVNPDGYDYTWTDNRLWRKNRSPNSGSTCLGTDLNRNYEFKWGGVGSSSNPCSETFGGVGAASELETRAVQSHMDEIADSLKAWITIHSYSQFWLIPWGDSAGGSCEIAEDDDEMMMVANAAANASEAANGDDWDRGNWCRVLYASTGILQDQAKSAGVKYTFTPELRGNSFIIDPSEIEISYQEVWSGVKAIVETIPEDGAK